MRDIRDGDELEEFEARLTFLRGLRLASDPIVGEYDLAHLLGEEDRLRGLDRGPFIDRLAHYLGDVNALHPFRDGNGRAQRAFFAQLAAEAGYRLDWQFVDPQHNAHVSMATMQGDEMPMRNLLAEITKPI